MLGFKNQYGDHFKSTDELVEMLFKDAGFPEYFFENVSAEDIVRECGGELSTNNPDDMEAIDNALDRLRAKLERG